MKFVFLILAAAVIGVATGVVIIGPAANKPLSPILADDVRQVIVKLKPLARHPYSNYNQGVVVEFLDDGQVVIILETRSDSRIFGKGNSLEEAKADMMQQSDAVKSALQ